MLISASAHTQGHNIKGVAVKMRRTFQGVEPKLLIVFCMKYTYTLLFLLSTKYTEELLEGLAKKQVAMMHSIYW